MNLVLELLAPAMGLIAILAVMIHQSQKTQAQAKRVKVKSQSRRP